MNNMSISDLLALREWLTMWSSSMAIESKYIRQAAAVKSKIDKEIWAMVVSNDTPWGTLSKEFTDDDFANTIKKYFDAELK